MFGTTQQNRIQANKQKTLPHLITAILPGKYQHYLPFLGGLFSDEMKLFEQMRLKFENSDWAKNPEFGLIDTILEQHPEIIKLLEADVVKGCKLSEFGRQDMPSVEQIVRAAIYKE